MGIEKWLSIALHAVEHIILPLLFCYGRIISILPMILESYINTEITAIKSRQKETYAITIIIINDYHNIIIIQTVQFNEHMQKVMLEIKWPWCRTYKKENNFVITILTRIWRFLQDEHENRSVWIQAILSSLRELQPGNVKENHIDP